MFVVRQVRRSAPVLPAQYFVLSSRQAAMRPLPPAEALELDDMLPDVALLLLVGLWAAATLTELSISAAASRVEFIFMSASFIVKPSAVINIKPLWTPRPNLIAM
jgi:hypothetical protein